MHESEKHQSFRQREAAALGKNKELVNVTVRLRPDQVEQLKVMAAKKRTPDTKNMSAIIRLAIDEFFNR